MSKTFSARRWSRLQYVLVRHCSQVLERRCSALHQASRDACPTHRRPRPPTTSTSYCVLSAPPRYHTLSLQWRRICRKIRGQGQSSQAIKLFQAPRKTSFTFHFRHKFFIFEDAKTKKVKGQGRRSRSRKLLLSVNASLSIFWVESLIAWQRVNA